MSLESHSFCDNHCLVYSLSAKMVLKPPDIRTRCILPGGGEKGADGEARIESRTSLDTGICVERMLADKTWDVAVRLISHSFPRLHFIQGFP